jgi:nucleoside-diphosphate-sugar epimerase
MELNSLRILLTGSEGKLGRRIKKRLSALGVPRIVHFDKKLGQDILDYETVRQACSECNITIHVAGLPHPGLARADKYIWTNTIGSLILLEEAIAAKHLKFIFVSSGAVYGWDLEPPINLAVPVSETSPLAYAAAEPYTVSKIMAEQVLNLIGNERLIDIVILRLAPIWNVNEKASEKFLCAAVSPDTVVNAVINSLTIDMDRQVSVYNIADPERQGNYSIDKALYDGIITSKR